MESVAKVAAVHGTEAHIAETFACSRCCEKLLLSCVLRKTAFPWN